MAWMNSWRHACGWRRFACVMAVSLVCLVSAPVAAGEWVIEDATGAPGDTVHVPVFFRADGQTVAAIARVTMESPLRVRPQGPLPSDGEGICVVDEYGRVRVSLDTARREAGTLIRVCSMPVTVPRYFRTRVRMTISPGGCLDGGAQPVECIGRTATFLVDGVPRWYERAAVVVPHAAPIGPTQDALLQFDYANNPGTPPLRSFDAPRPVHVDTIFAPGDWAFRKGATPPNAAVAALLRAVRPTYASAADHAAGVEVARHDPQVEAVIPSAGLFPYRIYPERPVAGQPFALWFATDACGNFTPSSYDDRIVRVEGNTVIVLVPEERDNICFGVPPGGEFHYLFNMPGLSAGQYSLQVAGYDGDPDVPSSPSWPLQFEVAPGGVVEDPVRIPASGFVWLFALGFGLVVLALRVRLR